MAPRRAESVKLSALARSIDSAVKLAVARQGINVGGPTVVHDWEIIGRVLRDKRVGMDEAFTLASAIASKVSVPGLRIEPVVSRIGKDILVGFVERGRFNKILSG